MSRFIRVLIYEGDEDDLAQHIKNHDRVSDIPFNGKIHLHGDMSISSIVTSVEYIPCSNCNRLTQNRNFICSNCIADMQDEVDKVDGL